MRSVYEDVLASLQALGLSLYEARLYVGLLAGGPQNGNELSKTAGVPSSKVYGTLNKLVRSGVVSQVSGPDGVEYACVSAEVLTEKLRRKFDEPLEHLETVLPSISGGHVEPSILTLSSWDIISEEARKIIRGAQQNLRLSIWSEHLDEIREDLADAEARGVEVFAMIYGEGSLEAGSWLQHSYREIVADRLGGQMLTLVADGREVLIAHLPHNHPALGIRTENPVLCLMVEEYLHHDFVLEKAKASVGSEDWDEWWKADPLLRDVILGRLLSHTAPPGGEDS
jgi:sugar-specific transcriptional regulator TrmB